jgi:DNA-binding IclR family transcriptional regulator
MCGEPKRLSSQRRAIMSVLRRSPIAIGPMDIAAQCGIAHGNVRFLLHAMVRAKQIERVKHGRYRVK